MRLRAKLSTLWYWLPFITIAAIWEALSESKVMPSYALPSLQSVVQVIGDKWGYLWSEGWWTIQEILIGFFISAALGVPLGVLIVWSKALERVLYPPLIALNSIPKTALIPLFIVWFGFGLTPRIVITVLLAFFPILVNTVSGLRSVDPSFVDLARSTGCSKSRMFLSLRIPHALPDILAGLRIASSLCVIGAVVAEFIASDHGWGYLLVLAGGTLDTATIFAVIILLSVVSMAFYYLIVIAERLIIPWHSSVRAAHVEQDAESRGR